MMDRIEEKKKIVRFLCTDPGEESPAGERMCAMELIEVKSPGEIPPGELFLHRSAEGLWLEDGKMAYRGDYSRMMPRLRKENLARETLLKAAKGRNYRPGDIAADATAGMGEDSLLLAAGGFEVYLYEYNPVIAALLEDTLRRFSTDPFFGDIVCRMHLIGGDSTVEMAALPVKPKVILLDPMFPERQKSGAIKKKFQLLQQLERPCDSEERLWEASLRVGAERIVVKRPVKGPCLAGQKPDYILDGSTIRYDVYVQPGDRGDKKE